ncbi:hypothetical protein KUTeg_001292 [Tegillarca granosa]|uniref:Uncharacterized protein n=1 Tax=Tegillarca granosa TaxID=220873 RepID=A0ABQ9FWK6_TEGGR|nr:hypothetical protein KUTeg_001292 [Tegillarca granosa]
MSNKRTGNDNRNKKTQKVNNLLEKLYYNTSKAAAYSGPDKLYRVLKTQGVKDIERVIKTLKKMIYRYFTKNRTHRYVDVLQSLVDSYNTTPHRS